MRPKIKQIIDDLFASIQPVETINKQKQDPVIQVPDRRIKRKINPQMLPVKNVIKRPM